MVLTTSVIKIDFIIIKFPRGAVTDTKESIGPTVVIEPGNATGEAGVGLPRERPPRADVNPYGPAGRHDGRRPDRGLR